MTKFFNILKKKKLVFGPFLAHFPNFWGKKSFLENLSLSRTTSYGFLASYQDFQKTNDTIPRNAPTDGRTDGRTEWRKDGQTIFNRTLPANAGGPIINIF